MDVTAAIIVKDEERCIKRCIESVLTLFKEVVVVDSGSRDAIIEP
jgi:glycosyltransferase involved in cell wall biosynthesis